MDADPGLERLLDLDGFLAEVGGGYWVKVQARQVPADAIRTRGVAYTLTLHAPGGARVFGIDNAHAISRRQGPSARSTRSADHLHRGSSVRPYHYRDADTLLADFWAEVAAILRKEGIE